MCESVICFISSVYILGAIGIQPNNTEDAYPVSNLYGYNIGELSIVIEFSNSMYIEAKHISGLNVAEEDNGLNAIMIGTKIRLK